jgi:tetratricopeptide (TPR) repeat protein
MKRKAGWIALGGIVLVIIGAVAGWQARQAQIRVASFLPPMPAALDQSPPALRDHIAQADAGARRTFGAVKGLGQLARVYHANGFFAEASRCYAGLEQLQPREPRWPHLHATILAGYGEIEPALALWEKACALAPEYLAAQLRRGDSLLKANRPAEATAAYEAALKLEANNPYALLGLARLDLEAGRYEQARPRLEQIVRQTNYTLGYDLIVSLYERLGLTQRATEIRSLVKASGAYRDPADPWFDSLLDDCFEPYRLSIAAGTIARNGDQAGARRLLERAVEVAPDDVSVIFQLGTLLVAMGDRDGARWHLRRCTELAPDFADGWANLSALQASLGDNAEADRTLAAGLKNCPQSPGLHLQYARRLRDAGRIGEAIPEYQASIRLRPNEPEAYIELGTLYFKQGRDAEGIAQMRGALVAEPGNPVALSVLTMSAISAGNEAEATRWFAALRNQPRIPREQAAQLKAAYQQKFGRAP